MCMLTGCDPEDDIATVVASNLSPRDAISPPDIIALVQHTPDFYYGRNTRKK